MNTLVFVVMIYLAVLLIVIDGVLNIRWETRNSSVPDSTESLIIIENQSKPAILHLRLQSLDRENPHNTFSVASIKLSFWSKLNPRASDKESYQPESLSFS